MAWILRLGPSLGLVRVLGIGLVNTELVPLIFFHLHHQPAGYPLGCCLRVPEVTPRVHCRTRGAVPHQTDQPRELPHGLLRGEVRPTSRTSTRRMTISRRCSLTASMLMSGPSIRWRTVPWPSLACWRIGKPDAPVTRNWEHHPLLHRQLHDPIRGIAGACWIPLSRWQWCQ